VGSKALKSGAQAAAAVTKASGLSGAKAARRAPKGRVFPAAALLGPNFAAALTGVAPAGIRALREMGVQRLAEFKQVLIEAHKRLNKARVTATDWLGETFEIIGADLPEVDYLRDRAVVLILSLVNQHTTGKKSGNVFVNGRRDAVAVKSPFRKRQRIRSCLIREAGQAQGHKYVDLGDLVSNADDQHLFVSTEFKTRGAGGGLLEQIAARDARIAEALAKKGSKLVFTVEGETTPTEIDLDDIVFIRDRKNPALVSAPEVFSKIGVRAGSRFNVEIAKDAAGNDYIRIIVPVATDRIRKILEQLLRDKSWQK
jgi:hypothetical protein